MPWRDILERAAAGLCVQCGRRPRSNAVSKTFLYIASNSLAGERHEAFVCSSRCLERYNDGTQETGAQSAVDSEVATDQV
jgi:hypothetical protein